MKKLFAIALAAAFALGGAVAIAALRTKSAAVDPPRFVFAERAWPFATDQWGKGRAFRCAPSDCGAAIDLYLRAKIGFCDCTLGVADDEALDRMSDFDLAGGNVAPRGDGRAISVGHMRGRSRVYALNAPAPRGWSVLSVAYNDRCDMVVATVLLPPDGPAPVEDGVLAFLNSAPIQRWVEQTLGL